MKLIKVFFVLSFMVVAFASCESESILEKEMETNQAISEDFQLREFADFNSKGLGDFEETTLIEFPRRMCTLSGSYGVFYIDQQANGTYTISNDSGYYQVLSGAQQAYEHCADGKSLDDGW